MHGTAKVCNLVFIPTAIVLEGHYAMHAQETERTFEMKR